MNQLLSLVLLFLTTLICTPAMAQGAPSALSEQRYGSVAYISGGVGEEERDELRLREREFNLKLLFSERNGAYLGDVDVTLMNAKGETVLDAKSVGPLLLAQLPSGRYAIKVSSNGQMQQRKLAIPAKGRHQGIFWW